MNQKHFEQIKAREQAATPAPWKIGNESEECRIYGANVVVGEKGSNSYVVMYRPIYPKETEFNNQVFADMQFAAHARTDMPAMIEQHEQDQQQIATLKKAYELMVKFLVSTGFADYVLCDQIPDALHKKYQPKDDGNYDNEPCIQCVQEYFMQQAQTELSHEEKAP